MSDIFKPMLACDADLEKLRFPLLASTKLDGIRAVVRDGVVYSRTNKPIPNLHVQSMFSRNEYFDGELIVGSPTAHDVYRATTSGVMSVEEKPDVRFYVFDHIRFKDAGFEDRHSLIDTSGRGIPSGCVLHTHYPIDSIEKLLEFESETLEQGYEGLILRDPVAPYKMGRSTVKEGYMLKLKRFSDAEYKVVGFEERQHNGNEAKTNELGKTKRSSHQSGKTGRGDLGALILQGDGFTFNCGTGFTDDERDHIWRNRDQFHGKMAKVKSFKIGVKDKPRHPVFLGWRDKRDM